MNSEKDAFRLYICAFLCRYLRSLLRVDFPQSQPWNSETATQFSETVTVVAQSHEIRILNPAWLANFIVGSHITAFVDVQFIRHELREKIEPNRHHGLEKSVRILKNVFVSAVFTRFAEIRAFEFSS